MGLREEEGTGSGMVRDRREVHGVRKMKYLAVGGGGGQVEPPESPRHQGARGSQNPVGMTLAKIPNGGEIEPIEAISRR